ncbi:ArsR/SmtB family transcription factor [Bacillus massilinigeriensis]|uniref:ArsR/SmtB family transcription factor n=1 Tax=Bacillus mediterraneensis TaxID=1805474 RepID=UPI0009F6B0B9|nr:metalloregulator ArsR/SmtB family transcription factor [Bacillus mediterraneensis]
MKQGKNQTPRIFSGNIPLYDNAETERLAMIAKALSDPIRIQMVYFLQNRSDLCTCEFEELLGLAQSKVSYHLNILFKAKLIEREIHGSWSHYKLRDQDVFRKLQTLRSSTVKQS